MATTRTEELARLRPKLMAFALSRTRNRDQAEDAVQEALVAALEGLDGYAGNSSLSTWLFAIVRNEFLRAAGGAAPAAESLDGLELADERPELFGLEMRDALLALPPSYAEPLALQVLGGFSCAEIAGMIGASEGATMTRLTRARQALRRLAAPRERKAGPA